MKVLAVIDATRIDAPHGPATQVAGLSLLERTIRLALVCGVDEILLRLSPDDRPAYRLKERPGCDVPIAVSLNAHPLSLEGKDFDAVVGLDAGAVFERQFVNRSLDELPTYEPGETRRSAGSHLLIARLLPDQGLEQITDDLAQWRARARPGLSNGWVIAIDSEDAAERASRRLWQSCRKAEDGLVARYLNRYLSIAISRVLAPTAIRPNHITALTFALGIAAAIAAAWGDYFGFLLAGILYQINSVVDGVDGELARVRYEFSVRGEWLDTISDDLADLLIYIGLGIGASMTLPDAPGPWGNELWLVLGIAAALGKVASMVVYYRWLIAHGRGDLLAFQWSFEDESSDDGPVARALSLAHYFFRKDFIVFTSMVFAIFGYFPHLLFALAPGNLIVAVSVVIQQVRSDDKTPPG